MILKHKLFALHLQLGSFLLNIRLYLLYLNLDKLLVDVWFLRLRRWLRPSFGFQTFG